MSEKQTADCYSDGERSWMELGQRIRGWCLNPLLRLLTHLRIAPDHLTLIAALVGFCFVPLYLYERPGWAFFCLALHVLLDGVDGPLARFQNVASPRGSFTDTFADQLVVSAVTIAWMVGERSAQATALGSLFIFLYALVVAMAMVRNAISVPYSWLVRPRFFVYVAMGLDRLGGFQLTSWILLVCNLLLALKSLTGFLALRKKIPGPEGEE